MKFNVHLHPDDSDYDHNFSTPDSHLAESGAFVFTGNLKGNMSVLFPGTKATSTGKGVTLCSNGAQNSRRAGFDLSAGGGRVAVEDAWW